LRSSTLQPLLWLLLQRQLLLLLLLNLLLQVLLLLQQLLVLVLTFLLLQVPLLLLAAVRDSTLHQWLQDICVHLHNVGMAAGSASAQTTDSMMSACIDKCVLDCTAPPPAAAAVLVATANDAR
jgi:hypothetical protein